LYCLSRLGFVKTASYILIAGYVAGMIFFTFFSGLDIRLALLLCALLGIVAGFLTNPMLGLGMPVFAASILAFGFYVWPKNLFLHPGLEPFFLYNEVLLVVFCEIAAGAVWLSHREFEKFLKREQDLHKYSELSHFAEVGKLSGGLLHDL